MSEQHDRDERTGQFVTGSKGGPGRRPGSRNKLGEQFAFDLRDVWSRRGIEVLERCAEEDPAALLRVIASLLPSISTSRSMSPASRRNLRLLANCSATTRSRLGCAGLCG